mgnify:CR=1 FL=1
MSVGLIAGAASSMIGGLIQGFGARRAARRQAARARRLQGKLNRLVANRQDVIDPSQNIVDRSGLISNTMGNLQVSTQAAEFQAEEADLSLASTLDTMRATGAGSGGATALAQAALRSKAGVSATIEKQEAENARLRAQGAQRAQQMRLAEGGRVDAAGMRGQEFMFMATEQRQFRDEDRYSALLSQQQARAQSLRDQSRAQFGQALGALGGMVTAGINQAGYNQAAKAGNVQGMEMFANIASGGGS